MYYDAAFRCSVSFGDPLQPPAVRLCYYCNVKGQQRSPLAAFHISPSRPEPTGPTDSVRVLASIVLSCVVMRCVVLLRLERFPLSHSGQYVNAARSHAASRPLFIFRAVT